MSGSPLVLFIGAQPASTRRRRERSRFDPDRRGRDALVDGFAEFAAAGAPGGFDVAKTESHVRVVFVDGERASTSPASPFVIANIAAPSGLVAEEETEASA